MSVTHAIASAVACTAALCVVGLLGPPGAAVLLMLVPLPGLVLGGLAGTAATAKCAALTALLVSAPLGVEAGALYLAAAGLPVVATVGALRAALRIERVMAGALGALVAGVGGLLWLSSDGGSGLQAALQTTWQDSFDDAMALYQSLGMSAERLSALAARREELGRAVLSLVPAIFAVTAGAVWFVNLRFSSRWAAWPQMRGLARWQAPPWLIWVFIGAGFAMFAPVPSVATAGSNLFVIVAACYFCQGLAIVSYFFQRFGLPRGLRVASYLLIVVQQIAAAVVLALGVFDFWGDFRRLGISAANARPGSDSD